MVEQNSPTEYFTRIAKSGDYPATIVQQPVRQYGLDTTTTAQIPYDPNVIPYDPNFKYVVIGLAIVAIVAIVYMYKKK